MIKSEFFPDFFMGTPIWEKATNYAPGSDILRDNPNLHHSEV